MKVDTFRNLYKNLEASKPLVSGSIISIAYNPTTRRSCVFDIGS